VTRLARRRPGQRIDMLEEMSRLTLEILEHTLFSQGLGRDTSEFQKAVNRYFNTVGRLDPFDLLGLPQFLPRFGRLRGQATLEWFAGAVADIIAARRATFSPCSWKRRTRKPVAACAKKICAPTSSPSSAPATRRPPMR
jgi:cytochrome P450